MKKIFVILLVFIFLAVISSTAMATPTDYLGGGPSGVYIYETNYLDKHDFTIESVCYISNRIALKIGYTQDDPSITTIGGNFIFSDNCFLSTEYVTRDETTYNITSLCANARLFENIGLSGQVGYSTLDKSTSLSAQVEYFSHYALIVNAGGAYHYYDDGTSISYTKTGVLGLLSRNVFYYIDLFFPENEGPEASELGILIHF